jgi:hypothetical protein
VLATQQKKMTSMHEKIAGGKFSNCASAIELGKREVSTAPTEVALDGKDTHVKPSWAMILGW